MVGFFANGLSTSRYSQFLSRLQSRIMQNRLSTFPGRLILETCIGLKSPVQNNALIEKVIVSQLVAITYPSSRLYSNLLPFDFPIT